MHVDPAAVNTPRDRPERGRPGLAHFAQYLVNAPPAWFSEFGPSAA
jgi:hypothetical protein